MFIFEQKFYKIKILNEFKKKKKLKIKNLFLR